MPNGKQAGEQRLDRYRARAAQYRRLAKSAQTADLRDRCNDLAEAYERLSMRARTGYRGARQGKRPRKRRGSKSAPSAFLRTPP